LDELLTPNLILGSAEVLCNRQPALNGAFN
jgi:hypothetical protein